VFVTAGPPFPCRPTPLVASFTEHFLEHLDYYEEAPRFLDGMPSRLCEPGGLLRVIVPDGGKYLHAYGDPRDLSSMRAFSPLVSMDASSDDRPFSSAKRK
jgi:hypothetical protein